MTEEMERSEWRKDRQRWVLNGQEVEGGVEGEVEGNSDRQECIKENS